MPIVSTSTSAFFERARGDMKSLRVQAETLQKQMGSGKRLTRSSDDPLAASRLRNLGRLEQLSDIDTSNANRANADLSLADSAISNIASTVIRAQELLMQASSDVLNQGQLSGIATELYALHDNLFALSNARDSNGHALFGGESAGNAYSLDASGNAVYIGTAGSGELPLGQGQSLTRSITGPEFLSMDVNGTQTDIMAVIKLAADAISTGAPDPAGAAKDALAGLQSGMDSVTTGQTVVGTRLAWIELTTERRTDLSELRTTEETEIGATDLPATIARLQETLLVLEASQASFSKLSQLSLLNQIG